MPKIELYADSLYGYIGKTYSDDQLKELLPCAKAEFDGKDESGKVLKIELNDTNRPDLWSTAGLARQLKIYTGGPRPVYDFFSRQGDMKDNQGRRVVVGPALKEIRPYIAAFGVTGKALDEPLLKDLIQTQEKLCWNFGQKRKSIAMGVYRSDILSYPVTYKAADPDLTRFIPLGMEKELTLREILKEHPKGVDFGGIVENFQKYPYLHDGSGDTLSFPPIINSAKIGAARVGDQNLFIELTGTDMNTLLLACSIVSCDLKDSGFTILPVKIEYPYDTPFGREIVTPYYFQQQLEMDTAYGNKLLGEKLSAKECAEAVSRVGSHVSLEGSLLTLTPPEYRNDFLHVVDIVEDIMIGRGMNSFIPEMPSDFTVGRLTAEEEYSRRVKNILIGLGFQEMVYNYLGSGKDFIERMNITGDDIIKISNPMTENHEYLRSSILPNLLSSESVSGNAVYPHNIFEIGKVACLDKKENYGTKTSNYLGFLTADSEAGFTLISSHISALFFYLSKEYTLIELDDPRFIKGRAAAIQTSEKQAGFFGEVHPAVLSNWGIQMPCTAGEVDLDALLNG